MPARRGYTSSSVRLIGAICAAAGVLAAGCALNKQIRVDSTPPAADVFIDGRRVGRTPIVVETNDLMPNRNFDGKIATRSVITVSKPGYDAYRLVVGEFSVPSRISARLVAVEIDESFENYLDRNPALREATVECADPPIMQTSRDLDAESVALYSKGYLLVAYSGYSAEGVAVDAIRRRAEKLGASRVATSNRDDFFARR
ncbi:MAG: PEGA domain-containing protein, partial [Myxococcales bacterium]